MKLTSTNPLPLHSLKISTRIRLHPDFVNDPDRFARRNGVDLVGEVNPSTSFKGDAATGEKSAKYNANIHLVEYGAIGIFTEQDNTGNWVKSIKLNPSILLHGKKNDPLVEKDLIMSQRILQNKVAPLLADPVDACHIVPGNGGDHDPIAYISAIETETLLPGIDLHCLHDLYHPIAGPAEGTTKNRIKLGETKDNCVITFKKAKCELPGPDGVRKLRGLRVRLSLKGDALVSMYGRSGSTAEVKHTRRLITFQTSDPALVHQMAMSRLEGTYLRTPTEWQHGGNGKPVTHAKLIALVSKLTPIPLEELSEMDGIIRQPSKSSVRLLSQDVPVEVGRLKPVPVSTLFKPLV